MATLDIHANRAERLLTVSQKMYRDTPKLSYIMVCGVFGSKILFAGSVRPSYAEDRRLLATRETCMLDTKSSQSTLPIIEKGQKTVGVEFGTAKPRLVLVEIHRNISDVLL